jgi:circadian clock protein KaiB
MGGDTTGHERRGSESVSQALWLRLYVVDGAPNSERARSNLRAILEQHHLDDCQLEVVNVAKEPLRALDDGVILTPTLLRLSPEPVASIVGDLSDPRSVMRMLGL